MRETCFDIKCDMGRHGPRDEMSYTREEVYKVRWLIAWYVIDQWKPPPVSLTHGRIENVEPRCTRTKLENTVAGGVMG
jgi:hypothetical protein